MNAYPYYGKIQKTRINFKVVSVFLAVLFWICGFMMLHGQSDLNFEHLSELQGLSQNSVWSILQDREGFMWFGTQDGLNKYDGYNFTVLKPDPDDPENSLHHNIISDIYEDRKGRLWVTTFGVGFHQVDKHTGRVTRLVLSLPIQSSGMYLLPFMKTSKAYYGLVELEE